jgi:hypothetical protein
MKVKWLALMAALFSTPALSICCVEADAGSPFNYPVPLTCTRNFYVKPTGSDVSGCGAIGNECATMQGADQHITGLTGGDCVNLAPGSYNTNGKLYISTSGTSNQANGYITYIGAPNRTSKIFWNQPTFFGGAIRGNYVAFVGLEFDGNNLQGYHGYSPSNTNTYNAQQAIFDAQDGSGHHHMFFNNVLHGSGGAAGSSIGSPSDAQHYSSDYEIWAGNELYDLAGVNGCSTSGFSILNPQAISGFSSSLPWDTQRFHLQYINNYIHDAGLTAALDSQCGSARTDGNGIIMDSFDNSNHGFVAPYPYETLIMGNVVYNIGGRGIYVLSGGSSAKFTVINNTSYNTCFDNIGGCAPCDVLFGTVNSTWENNICWTTNDTGSEKRAIHFTGDGRANTGNVYTNNLTFNGTPGQQSAIIDGAYSAAFPGNNPLLGTDPKLTNVGAANFIPLSGSPVIGAGVAGPSGYPLMAADGKLQPTPPNVGAFNPRGPPPSVVGPVSISAGGAAASPFVADAGFSGGSSRPIGPALSIQALSPILRHRRSISLSAMARSLIRYLSLRPVRLIR